MPSSAEAGTDPSAPWAGREREDTPPATAAPTNAAVFNRSLRVTSLRFIGFLIARESDTASVLLGNGDGTFQAAVAFWLCAPSFAAVADLDADSVTGNCFTDRVTVLLPETKGWLMLVSGGLLGVFYRRGVRAREVHREDLKTQSARSPHDSGRFISW
jgi:hypothetical protein